MPSYLAAYSETRRFWFFVFSHSWETRFLWWAIDLEPQIKPNARCIIRLAWSHCLSALLFVGVLDLSCNFYSQLVWTSGSDRHWKVTICAYGPVAEMSLILIHGTVLPTWFIVLNATAPSVAYCYTVDLTKSIYRTREVCHCVTRTVGNSIV